MRLNRIEEAIPAFSKCCSIDESNGEAWANLAGCLQMKGDLNKAMAMLEQATKYQETNWRIWCNLMNLSFKNKKFNRFYNCVEKLSSLNHVRNLILIVE
jgi:Flp pilus assembly protein TadD